MMRWKYFSVLILSVVLMLVWAFGGAMLLDGVEIEAPRAQAPAPKVKVLIRTGTESEAMRRIAQPFEQETGIQVEFIEVGRDGYFTAIGTQLLAGTDTFDVVFMPNTSIAQFASTKAILPLDGFIGDPKLTDAASFDSGDFLDTYRYKGVTYALPTDISTHFLYYRSDLIPQPPETWEELSKLARTFTASLNPSSPTKWGLAMPAVVPEERGKIFASLLWSFGGDILQENDGQVLFDSPESVAAGAYLERLVTERTVPDDLLSWDFARTRDALVEGTIAMAAPYWNSAFPQIRQSESSSPFKSAIRVALIPGVREADGTVRRAPFQHGWTLAINASSSHALEAWEFLKFATGKRGGMIYANAGGVPARRSILSDPTFKETRPEFPLVLESMNMAKREPSVPYYPAMVDVEERALAKIVTRYAKPGEAFVDASEELRRLLAQLNR